MLVVAGFLLLIPLLAMPFTNEVNWGVGDFVVAAMLLFGLSFLLEMLLRAFTKTSHRLVLGGTIVVLFLLVWAELAVGILGTPLAGS